MKYTKMLLSFSLFVTLAVFGLFFSEKVSAEESSSNASEFSMDLELPENQIDSSLGYFLLKVKPNQEQKVAIKLSNTSKQDMVVNVEANPALTNSKGVVVYSKTSKELDASQLYDYRDIVKAPESVELAAGETKELTIDIKMPEKEFDGILVGGIRLLVKDADDAKSNSESTSKNISDRVVGLVLRETDEDPKPDLKYNKTYAEQTNSRNAIYVDYSNITATYLNGMTTEVQISKADSKDILYEAKETGMRMAPNSNITFPVTMNGEAMVPGQYKAHILITSEAGRWEWTEKFTITKEESKKFNARDKRVVQKKTNKWLLIAGIIGGILLLIVVGLFILKGINKKNQQKKKGKKKKKIKKN